jgi:hypothetical protein
MQAELKTHHLLELTQSAICSDIIRLNFESIDGEDSFDFLVQNPERRNDGRLTDRYLRSHQQLAGDAWKCMGIDILTMTPSSWGCVKLDNSRFDHEKRKPIKYEQPRGVECEIFCLRVTWAVGLKIAKNQGMEVEYRVRIGNADLHEEDCDFWKWVVAIPKLILVPTEGAKKTASLLTAGSLAIGLPGIWMGVRSKRNGVPAVPYLIPQLEVFCHPDREFVFCFDRDEKPKTIAEVQKAIEKTGKLLQREGCKVSIVGWSDPYKGVDDLLFAMGGEVFFAAFDDRLSLDNWRLADLFSLDAFPQHKVNSRYLSQQDIPQVLEGLIVGVKSAKGTGKTHWIGDLLKPEIEKGRSVLIITHRIQLARELARRIGVAHISEVRSNEAGAIIGYSLCIDSLHSKSQANFNPEAWENAVVVIDECDQVLWHLLNSPTCQSNRVAILQSFQRLLRTVAESDGTVILSDADLSRVSIEYIQKLTEGRMPLWLMVNGFLPSQGKRKLFVHESPGSLLSKAVSVVESGDRVIFHLSAQKTKSKWSTQNVESLMRKKFPNLRIVRVDADTVADPSHAAFACIDRINSFVAEYDIVLCSPTVETGISIDVNHFDSVWAIANGVQTVDAVCQAIERVRSDVPRHLSIATGGLSFCGNGSDSIKSLVLSQKRLFKSNLSALSKVDMIAISEGFSGAHLNTWGCFAARVNQGFKNYRENIVSKLKKDGYDLAGDRADDIATIKIEEAIQEAKTENYDLEIESKIAAENPNDYELELLSQKTSKTKIERDRQSKGLLCRKYLTEDVDRDLIIKDDDGWHPQLQLFYYLTCGAKHLKGRDKTRLEGLSEDKNVAFIPDGNRVCLSSKIAALRVLGVEQFFGEDKTFTDGGLTKWHNNILQYRFQIKDLLGITIGLNSTPVRAAQVLLGVLGFRLDYLDRARINGVPTRRYGGVDTNFDCREEILQRWIDRDNSALEVASRSTTSIKELGVGGGSDVAA